MFRSFLVAQLVLVLSGSVHAQLLGHDGRLPIVHAIALGGPALGDPPSDTLVDLVWEPVVDWHYVGEVFEVQLIARTQNGQDRPVAAIDAILQWDPMHLALLGADNGPYNWLLSGFPDDSLSDGINDTFLDGDAFYRALSNFGNFAVATPEGLHVATFRFEALQETDGVQIALLPAMGKMTTSQVFGTDFPGQTVTGNLGAVTLRICSGAPGDDDADGVENCLDACPGTPKNEVPAPDGCACSQINCDDGVFCNGLEGCAAGICLPGADPCDDSVACTVDTCDELLSVCTNVPAHADCDDGMFCNGAESCDAVQGCMPGVLSELDDGVACTVDTCDEENDTVSHTPDNAVCDDGAFCNGPETCDAEQDCQPGIDPPAYLSECRCFDADDDGDVDIADFAEFQRNFTGS